MDLPSRSISHAVSPVARVVPDLRAGAGLGSPVREVVLRTPARRNGHHPTLARQTTCSGVCSTNSGSCGRTSANRSPQFRCGCDLLPWLKTRIKPAVSTVYRTTRMSRVFQI
jgi:hypothetical protein